MIRERMASLSARPGAAEEGRLDPWVVPAAAARLRAAFMGRVLRRLGRRLARTARAGVMAPVRRRERVATEAPR